MVECTPFVAHSVSITPADRRQRGLRCVVDGEQRRRLAEHAPGRDVDDVPVAALQHPGRDAADQPQRGVVVEHHGPVDVVPALQRLGQRPADGPPGVVDQDVHSAETLLDVGGQRVDGVQIGQVAGDRCRVAAVLGDPADQLVEQILAAGHRDHGGAVPGELFGADSPMPDEAPVSSMRSPARSILAGRPAGAADVASAAGAWRPAPLLGSRRSGIRPTKTGV